jgi:hypothetical protein
MTYDTPMPLGSDDFYNSLSEDWNEPYQDAAALVSPEKAQTGQAQVNQAVAEMESHSFAGTGLLSDRYTAALLIGLLRKRAM